MNEGLSKFLGFVSVVGIICIIIYQNANALAWIVVAVVALIVGIIILFKLNDNRAAGKISDGVAEGSPMKVNLRVEQLSGRKHRLHIDVKMSSSDWDAIRSAGLVNHSLFQHDGVTSMDNYYGVGHLLRVHKVDFDDMQELNSAKDTLLANLHALRTRIDSQKRLAETPAAERTESYEV